MAKFIEVYLTTDKMLHVYYNERMILWMFLFENLVDALLVQTISN